MPSPDSIVVLHEQRHYCPRKTKAKKGRKTKTTMVAALPERSHACFRLSSAATVKRDLKGGALGFESTAADDAKGRFLGSPAIASPPSAPACCPAQAWLPSYGGCCPPLLGSVCRCSVCHAGSGNCQGCRVSLLVARAARFSSDHHPLEQCAPVRARACSRAHTCVRVHAHPPPVVATCSPNRDQVIVSDLLCLYAFVSPRFMEKCPKQIDKVQIDL